MNSNFRQARQNESDLLSKLLEHKEGGLPLKDLHSLAASMNTRLSDMKKRVSPNSESSSAQLLFEVIRTIKTGPEHSKCLQRAITDINTELLNMEETHGFFTEFDSLNLRVADIASSEGTNDDANVPPRSTEDSISSSEILGTPGATRPLENATNDFDEIGSPAKRRCITSVGVSP